MSQLSAAEALVLQDQLQQAGLGAKQAALIANLAANQEAVERLFREAFGKQCRECVTWGILGRHDHHRDCSRAAFYRAVVPGWAEAELETAHGWALAEEERRSRRYSMDGRAGFLGGISVVEDPNLPANTGYLVGPTPRSRVENFLDELQRVLEPGVVTQAVQFYGIDAPQFVGTPARPPEPRIVGLDLGRPGGDRAVAVRLPLVDRLAAQGLDNSPAPCRRCGGAGLRGVSDDESYTFPVRCPDCGTGGPAPTLPPAQDPDDD